MAQIDHLPRILNVTYATTIILTDHKEYIFRCYFVFNAEKDVRGIFSNQMQFPAHQVSRLLPVEPFSYAGNTNRYFILRVLLFTLTSWQK